jgi:2'-5' RNA ligase
LLPAENQVLRELQQQLASRLIDEGFDLERRRFRPHITLARLRRNQIKPELQQEPVGLMSVTGEVNLYQSELEQDGAHYTVIAHSRLHGFYSHELN